MSTPALVESDSAFYLDGQPFRILSGAIHYFRIHPEQWNDRLYRLRHLGLNTVDVYVPWNFHEADQGVFEFSGWKNVAAFIELAQQMGLKVMLRPGPYIAAEWDMGGLPAWLLTEPRIALRCSDSVYQHHVERWFRELLPRLAHLQYERGGPIIAVQVENEYGTFGNDHRHLQWLADLIRRCEFDSMLFCNSGVESDAMLRGGSLPDILTTVDFDGPPDIPFDRLESFQPGSALFCSEHWIGWFDTWGDVHHTVDHNEVARNVEAILARGASVNLYMAVGGTNFGWTGGATIEENTNRYQPMTTSYDYDAPISEDGSLTPKFHALREVISRYHKVPVGPAPAQPLTQTPQLLTPAGSRALFDSLGSLGAFHDHVSPPSMELLGHRQGLLLYRTFLDGPLASQPLTIPTFGDRAMVFLDGEPLGILDRNDPYGSAVPITVTGQHAQLDILLDTFGRVNYGPYLWDPKGIRGPVLLGSQSLFHWKVCPLPMFDISALSFNPDHSQRDNVPQFQQHALENVEPLDAHLHFTGYSHCLVWLNGQTLGRWWGAKGPQQTLYAPGPFWQEGRNTITVLSFDGKLGTIETVPSPSWAKDTHQ